MPNTPSKPSIITKIAVGAGLVFGGFILGKIDNDRIMPAPPIIQQAALQNDSVSRKQYEVLVQKCQDLEKKYAEVLKHKRSFEESTELVRKYQMEVEKNHALEANIDQLKQLLRDSIKETRYWRDLYVAGLLEALSQAFAFENEMSQKFIMKFIPAKWMKLYYEQLKIRDDEVQHLIHGGYIDETNSDVQSWFAQYIHERKEALAKRKK